MSLADTIYLFVYSLVYLEVAAILMELFPNGLKE